MGALGIDPLEGHPKYRIVRVLGRGGMGEVFEAEHLHLGTRMVVKLLHAELAQRANQVDRMRIEAQSLARLHHPNVVRVTDFDTTKSGRPFFVMDYLEGLSLRQELDARGGWLPVAEALEIAQQALAGLASAHRLGLVHRDVKLDNLFLCDPTQGADTASDQLGGRSVKVLDFGVAKVLAADGAGPAPLAVPTATGIIVGTPRFLSPEQALGKPIDHRADIYSMGLVLHTLVVGRGPFDDCTTITDMARAHAFTAPATPSKIAPQPLPPALDAVMLRCLAKRPEDRFQRADDLAKELRQIQQELGKGPPSASSPNSGAVPPPHRSSPGEPATHGSAETVPEPPSWPRSDSADHGRGIDSTATRVRVHPASAKPSSSPDSAPSAPQAAGPAHAELVETTTDRAPTERIRKPQQGIADPGPQPQPPPPPHQAQSSDPSPFAPPQPHQPWPHPAAAPSTPWPAAAAPGGGAGSTILMPDGAPQGGPSGWPGWAAPAPSQPAMPPLGVSQDNALHPSAAAGSAPSRPPRWIAPAAIVLVAALTGAAIAAVLVRLF